MSKNWNDLPSTLPNEWEWETAETEATNGPVTISLDTGDTLSVTITDGHLTAMYADIPLSAIRALYRTLRKD